MECFNCDESDMLVLWADVSHHEITVKWCPKCGAYERSFEGSKTRAIPEWIKE